MTIELPEALEAVLKTQAQARGLTPDLYLREVLERDLGTRSEDAPKPPFATGYGMWKKYSINLSEADIDECRRDLFSGFGEAF